MAPDRVDLLLRQAADAFEADPAEARRLVLTAAEEAGDDPNQLTRCVGLLVHLGDYRLAKRYADHVGALEPDGRFALAGSLMHAVGRLALVAGNDEMAERALRLAFERDPEVAGHGRILAAFFAERGRRDEALRVIAQAQEHLPNHPPLTEVRQELEQLD
jgi:tetratricopeptide (TPR) repeat protein